MNLVDRLIDIGTRPVPLRTLILRSLLSRWPVVGSYQTRLRAGAVQRPHYAWCLYHAAEEARALGYKAITAIELGVAGGNGLLNLCHHRKDIQKELGVEIVVIGFDTGAGLPQTNDPRDLLYSWSEGSFAMDQGALERRIAGQAELVMGNVASTARAWQPRPDAPVGAIMFDLDLYSSTVSALGLLTKENVLPRVWCYFDDICGYPEDACTDSIGEREAIKQFNLDPERQILNDHLSPAFIFKGMPPESWHSQIYLYHRLNHPKYNTSLTGSKRHQLGLVAA
jgi:hypothetical protein